MLYRVSKAEQPNYYRLQTIVSKGKEAKPVERYHLVGEAKTRSTASITLLVVIVGGGLLRWKNGQKFLENFETKRVCKVGVKLLIMISYERNYN